MKARSLCILLTLFVILSLSTTAQATEYSEVGKEVNARDLLKHIENGDNVNLYNCTIVGELNASNMKLEKVTNPKFSELLIAGNQKEDLLIWWGIRENLFVIKSNIAIEQTIFEDAVDFSNVEFESYADFKADTFNSPTNFKADVFKDSANFIGATFKDSTDFDSATFYNLAYFNYATFYSYINFNYATFNEEAHFYNATFNNLADFHYATFKDSTDFDSATFSEEAHFCPTTFNGHTIFNSTTFKNSADFDSATFNNPTDFYSTNFNDPAEFILPETSNNIFTDGKMCEFFRRCYNDETRYTDADNIYYNFRKRSMDEKGISFSKLIDFLSWFTCGFGTNIYFTLRCAAFIVSFFAIIYRNPGVSLVKKRKYVIYPRFCWRKPGIYWIPDETNRGIINVSLVDCLCFSINTFTTLGSSNWRQRNKFWYVVTVEGVIGWIMLGIFLATLIHLLIKS
jgi:hypothetical protein